MTEAGKEVRDPITVLSREDWSSFAFCYSASGSCRTNPSLAGTEGLPNKYLKLDCVRF